MQSAKCQSCRLDHMSDGYAKVDPPPLSKRLYIAITRHIGPGAKARIKTYLAPLMAQFLRFIGKPTATLTETTRTAHTHLKAGDLVKVRSAEEIQATLDPWGELKRCGFLDGMWQYCGTTQRVLKPVERFLDERDYRMKRIRSTVLLEGLMCQGTPDFGRCDRACLFFWREEWLEKLDGS